MKLCDLSGYSETDNTQEAYLPTASIWGQIVSEILAQLCSENCIQTLLRGSLPKSGPLDFATKNTFPLFFFGEEALVGIY